MIRQRVVAAAAGSAIAGSRAATARASAQASCGQAGPVPAAPEASSRRGRISVPPVLPPAPGLAAAAPGRGGRALAADY